MPISLVMLGITAAITALIIIGIIFKNRTASATLNAEGFQEIAIVVKGQYKPKAIKVRRGIPLRLEFTRLEDDPCSEQVIFSDARLTSRLPAHQTTPVSFVPTKCGEILFTCSEGLYHGSLVVVEPSKRDVLRIAKSKVPAVPQGG